MKTIGFGIAAAAACALYAACGTAGCGSSRSSFDPLESGAGSTGAADATASGFGGDAALVAAPDCAPASTNLAGCPCSQQGQIQPCYSGNAVTRHVGACKDGTQTCIAAGEFATWGNCTGDVIPATEDCSGSVDANCNGNVGCADPSCATSAVCDTGCTDGQTRPCYDGPAGTENRGTCKDGVQHCVAGKWAVGCSGEVVPAAENCCDALDHNCNGLAGCSDLFLCITAACCQNACTPANVDPGCVCPTGSGDSAMCPNGDHQVVKGAGFPPLTECCPCTASTCSDLGCCGEAVCAGSSHCTGTHCKPLPPSCGGMVNADCDDFPEDCDEPCCKCTTCAP